MSETNKENGKRKLQSEDDTKKEKSVKVLKSEKRFKCSVCHSTFNSKSNLTRHLISHTASIKYSKCDRTFNRNDNLQTHIKRKHEQEGGENGLFSNDLQAKSSKSSNDDSQPLLYK